jgi:hypothetical protein
MASQEGSWSLVRSEDLPKGLSDGDDDSRSSEETPSVSGSSRLGLGTRGRRDPTCRR